jgi:site-specific DNA-methyltransferase (adenine-specific)
MCSVLFSHKSVEWSPPQDFYDDLDQKYHFTLDVASTHENAKCKKHYTIAEDGLNQPWIPDDFAVGVKGAVWCNPPYGKGVELWVRKAIDCGNKVVMLLPVRTSTPTFHDLIQTHGKVTFIRKRLKFAGFKTSARFDSMLVEFN